jgi:hypothetical protein
VERADGYWELRIPCLPNSSTVVDAATVEACATAACDAYNETCEGNRDGTLDGGCAWHAAALAVLAAADIKVADEVAYVEDASGIARPGDTLYIKRAVTADCHSKEG